MPDSKTNWTLFVPIYNLVIDSDMGGKLTIERVTFVSSDKIPKIRRLKEPVFTKTRVYACIKTKRSADDTLSREFHRIQEAVYLLASSQFHREPRRRFLFGSPDATSQADEYLIIENNGQGGTSNHHRTHPFEPYRLNKEWKFYLKRHFFFDLIKIMNQDIKVDSKWRHTIRQAAILAGQSQFTTKIWESFLYNMIAIESLLVDFEDRSTRTKDVMTNRFVAIFGWLTNERLEEWKEKFYRLCDLRNKFVHTGNIRGIIDKDVIDTDTILANLLRNICRLTEFFNSKRDIIELSKRLEARRILGMEPSDRPQGISYSSRTISELERKRLWWQ